MSGLPDGELGLVVDGMEEEWGGGGMEEERFDDLPSDVEMDDTGEGGEGGGVFGVENRGECFGGAGRADGREEDFVVGLFPMFGGGW